MLFWWKLCNKIEWCYFPSSSLFFSFSSPSFPSPSLLCPPSPLYLTGILQKESKFPRMVCRLNRDLHGLVTALKPTKTTKTLIADGQPVTSRGLDCEVHYHLSRTTLSKSCWFDLFGFHSPTVLKFSLIHRLPWFLYLFAFNSCLFESFNWWMLSCLKATYLLFVYCKLFTLLRFYSESLTW